MSSSIGWVNAIIRGGSGIVATIANVIIIYLGVRSKKFLTNYTNFTIFFLAVADFIFGFGAILRCINDLSPVLVDFGNTYQYNICSALLTPQVWSYQLRQLIVLFVALDMFCAIRFPFRYRLVPIRVS
uniref:G_PROTEIN_RECEP_F1_2 domain-containing protein n=1 Tax=Rhabditophanes sp. KR3021 TaxID=114890 RepID=A0AC35UGN2_9BILA